MVFDYQQRMVWMGDLVEPIVPGSGYALCEVHSSRLTPPVGWTLVDERAPVRRLFASLDEVA